MKLVGRSNQNRLKILARQHLLETAIRLLSLKFGGSLSSSVRGNVSDREQASLRYKTPQIFCVAPAHLSDAEYSDA